MIVTLEETKLYLRLDSDYTEEDTLIQTLISASEEHLYNATGIVFDNTNNLAKLYINILVADYYNKRSATDGTSEKTRFALQSIKTQLQYCYIPEA